MNKVIKETFGKEDIFHNHARRKKVLAKTLHKRYLRGSDMIQERVNL